MKKPYRQWRVLSLCLVHLLIALHITHWLLNEKTLAPLDLNEILYALQLGMISAGAIFMILAMLATFVFGRFFCSWACHMLALQDISEWVLKKMKIKVKPLRSRLLIWIPLLAMLYLFVWPLIERIISGIPWPGLSVHSGNGNWSAFITENFWRNLPGPWITTLTFLICGFLIVYLLGSRSFCRYACPWGALFGIADRMAPGRIVLTGDCTQCGLCTDQCSSGVMVHKHIKEFGMVLDHNCIKDLDCISCCPQNALQYKFTVPALLKKRKGTGRINKKYDFSLGEDLAIACMFILFLFIYRGLYDHIPFLLAMAISICLAYLILIFFRMMKSHKISLRNIILKQDGKITKSGISFLVLISLLIILTVHSAIVHFHSYLGELYFRDITGLDLIKSDKEAHLKAEKAILYFEEASRLGLLASENLNQRLASLHLSANNAEKALYYLRETLTINPDNDEARLRLGRLLLQNGHKDEALLHFKKLTSSGSVNTERERQLKGAAHAFIGFIQAGQGRMKEALQHYERSFRIYPDDPEMLKRYGDLLLANGYKEKAVNCYRKLAEMKPGHHLPDTDR